MSLRLGIDLDGVVADFNTGWITFYNEEFGTDIPLDAVDSWGAPPRLTHFRHMGEFWRWARTINDASLFRHLQPYPDALPALGRLAKAGHSIVILTSKPWWAVHDTFEWLAEHRIPTLEVHILEDKWTVPCDVYLDDAPHQVREILRHRPDATMCRFVRAWNDPVQDAVDIHSWADYLEYIDGREKNPIRVASGPRE